MKAFQRLLIAAPAAALLPVALAPMGVLANDLNLDLDAVQEYSISQNASIRDFSDVYPTDWAYQALAELVETYGCVGGYPDGTFRGDQPITRYEMAAVLSACLDSMSAKMDMMEDDMDSMENMEMLKAEFAEELIELKGEVDGLTAKVSALEETQFSTTTKAEFEIATDFVFFSTENEEARGIETPGTPGSEEMKDKLFLDLTPGSQVNPEDLEELSPSQELAISLTSGLETRYTGFQTAGSRNRDFAFVVADKKTGKIVIIDTSEGPDNEGIQPGFQVNGEDGIDLNNNGNVEDDNEMSVAVGSAFITNADVTADAVLNLNYASINVPTIKQVEDSNAMSLNESGEYVPFERPDGVGDDSKLTNAELAALHPDYLNTLIEEVITQEAVLEIPDTLYGEDNSGLALSSSVTIAFTTSFTGSDTLYFELEGDVVSMENHYLALGNFYDVADNGNTNVEFSGFSYERNFDLGVPVKLTLGTDVDDLDPIVGLDTYYAGSGYDGYGPGAHGDAGIGFSTALLNSDAGTVNFSASYAVGGDHASDQTGNKGFFGEDTNRGFAVALNWDGALFGGNESRFTVAYQNSHFEEVMDDAGMVESYEQTKSKVHLVAGTYFTETISLSGIYSFGKVDFAKSIFKDNDLRQWMVALNMDDAFFPGNSAGIAYGTPEYVMDAGEGMNPTKVLELYYSFKVNDNFTVPVYLDFINNAGNYENGNGTSKNAFGIAVRPTLTF